MQIKFLLLIVVLLGPALAAPSPERYGPKFEYGSDESKDHHVFFNYGSDGVYKFSFKLPDQSRQEERNKDGEVRGAYSFVDPEGERFSLQYLADKEGFQPTADHLPVPPEETKDVKEARDAFQAFYEKTVKYLEALSSREKGEDSGSRRPSSSGYGTPEGRTVDDDSDRRGGKSKKLYGGRRLGDVDGNDDEEEDSSSSEEDELEEGRPAKGDEEGSSEEDAEGDDDKGDDNEEDSSEEDEGTEDEESKEGEEEEEKRQAGKGSKQEEESEKGGRKSSFKPKESKPRNDNKDKKIDSGKYRIQG